MVIFNENIGVEILHNVGVFPVEYCVCSYVGLERGDMQRANRHTSWR